MYAPFRPVPRQVGRGPRSVALALIGWALVLAGPAWSAATDPVGRVTVTLNIVEAIAADGTVRPLKRTDAVYEGDTLRTGPRGRAQIRFTDRGLMSLRPASELVIDDYEFSAASPGTARQSLNLSRGGFRTMTGRIASANRSAYRVRTPLAVIGVRGTIWDAYQEAGGALLLGVGQGGITATTTAGEEARLGEGASYNYVRVNPDGSVEFLIEPPAELDNSPEVDEEGDGDEEGAELGDAEDSSVAGSGGDAESTAGLLAASGSQVVETTTNPDGTGAINQSNTGDGSLPTGGVVLSAADVTALITGTQVGIVAGVSSSDRDASGEFVLGDDRIGVGSGLAAFNGNGGPLLVGALGSSDFDPLFQTATREELLGLADAVLNSNSGGPSNLFSGGTFQPAGGAAGVTWGSFAQPGRIFIDQSNATRFVTTTGAPDILYAIGAPTDVATLTGSASYGLVDSRVVTTGGRVFDDLFTDAFLDFGTGAIEGILDVSILENSTATDARYFYIVDWQGSVQGGLLTGVVLTDATLTDLVTSIETPAFGEITGFLSGTGGEFLNLGFSYYVAGDPSLDASGLALLQAGVASGNALTPEETLLLGAGFGHVQAECCFTGRTYVGRVTDPRLDGGLDTVIGDGGLDPFDPGFNAVPAGTVIVRRDGAAVVNFNTFDLGAGAELSTFEWQGFAPNGPYGLYDPASGDLVAPLSLQILLLAGRIADPLALTGTGRFTMSQLAQGFFLGETGVPPTVTAGADFSFNVDFATARLFGGIGRVFLDSLDASLPAQDRARIEAYFSGDVALANGNPFVRFVIDGGFVSDSGGDFGGSGILDPGLSSVAGFFAGDGTVFNLAYNLTTAEDAGRRAPFERINAVGNAILLQRDLSLTAAELARLQAGRVFVAAECCDFDSGAGGGLAADMPGAGASFLLGLNQDALGDDLSPLDAGFLAGSPERILRPAGASRFALLDFPVPAEVMLAAGSIDGDGGSNALIIDAATGEITEQLGRTVLYMAGVPSTIATLQAAGFTTFSGASNVDVDLGMGPIGTLGGLLDTNLIDRDPSFVFAPGASVSFNVNFASGKVSNGHLFAVLEVDGAGPVAEEFGARVFFEGQVGSAAGNPFVDVSVIDGALFENIAIDTAESEIEIFFGGGNGSQLVALGAFNLKSAEASPTVVVGTFSIGNALLPDTRLTAADALRLSPAGGVRLGLAAFSRLSFGSPGGLPIGAEGLLLGRAGDASATSPPFLLGANALYVVDGSPDPQMPMPVPTNTARRGFFDQPFDFVLRKDTAVDSSFFPANANVIPPGGADFAAQGFRVSWGAWESPGSTDGAKIQDDPGNGANGVTLDRDVFFASVNPTPQSQMPVTGTFSYGGVMAAPGAYPVLGAGGGNISAAFAEPLSAFAANFDIDFGTGAISNGGLTAEYIEGELMQPVTWSVGFDGFVNGAVADLQVNSLGLAIDGAAQAISPPDPFANNISGIFTGPSGQRFLGGFSLQADVAGSNFESVQGVFVIDRN